MAEPRPQIAVRHHDQFGVVAMVSHESHVAEHMLRRVGFERLRDSDLYALAEPERDLTRRGQQAVQSLRAVQYSVTPDAAFDLQPLNPPAPGQAPPDRLAAAAATFSPARVSASLPHRPAVDAAYRPAPPAPQPVRAR